jgi:hypothetical protein
LVSSIDDYEGEILSVNFIELDMHCENDMTNKELDIAAKDFFEKMGNTS